MRDLKKFTLLFYLISSLNPIFSQDPQAELTHLQKSIQIPYDYKWYNPNQIYLQINTTKDAIYFLSGKEIIQTDPRFNNKLKKHLHLYHKGKQQPIFFSNDKPNLSENDTLIFVGSRPKGDTTWLDSYSSFEAFFLVYDESTSDVRFQQDVFQPQNNSIIEYSESFEHLEEAHKYSIGMPEFSSETVNGEGWVWELLQPNPSTITSKSLKFSLDLFPAFRDDSIFFKIFALSARYELNRTIHKLLVKINGDSAFFGSFPPGADIVFNFSYPSSRINFGKNIVEITSLGQNLPDSLQPENIVGVQYLEINYKKLLFFNKNPMLISIQSSHNNCYKAFGFNSPEIIVIDTSHRKIYFTNGIESVHYFVNIKPDTPYINVIFNDSNFTSLEQGLHLFSFDSSNKKLTYKYFQESSNQILSYLSSIPSSACLLSIFNGNFLPLNVIQFYELKGSQKVREVQNERFWVFAQNLYNGEVVENTFSKDQTSKFFANFVVPTSNFFTLVMNFRDTSMLSLYVSTRNSLEKPILLKVDSSNLFTTQNQAEVIVIYPNEFAQIAKEYVKFRKLNRPNLNFFIASTENIYKEFNFGKKSPHAIKRFLVWAYNKWQKPRIKYCVIIGDASWDSRQLLSDSPNKDFVPTYGWPATDYWYSLIDSLDFNADINVGRIPIRSNDEGNAYIKKLQEYEYADPSPWMKNFLFLSGGITEYERNYFYDLFKGYFVDYILLNSAICVTPKIIRKSDPNNVGEADASAIRSAINDGLQLMYFAGHGSASVFDTDGWPVQTLNNKGKYGFFASFSCNTATFAEPKITSRNEEYVLWPDKGFIGTLGSGGVSFRVNSLTLGNNLLSVISNPKYKTANFVELLNIAKRQQTLGEYTDLLTIYHYNFLGDPLLELKIPRKPDLYFIQNSISIKNERNTLDFQQADSFFVIKGKIANLGFAQLGKTLTLRISHSYFGESDSVDVNFNDLCSFQEFSIKLPIRGNIGIHNFKFVINPNYEIDEENYLNNLYLKHVEVYSNPIFVVEPQNYWNVSRNNPIFRFIDPSFSPDSFNYYFAIYTKPDTLSFKIVEAQSNDLFFSKAYIQWNPQIQLDSGCYWLFVQRVNKLSSGQTQPLWINFNSIEPIDSTIIILEVKPEGNLNFFNFDKLQFDPKNKYLTLKPDSLKFKILSASAKRGKEIAINDRIYVTYSTQSDFVGFYLVVVSGDDFKVIHNKYFDTWAPKNEQSPLLDSNSIKLFYFLRDSIPNGDYLFLLTYGSAFALPFYHQWYDPKSPGSMDSLRSVLKEWGCRQCDSLGIDTQVWGSSYYIVARNIHPRKLFAEGFSFKGDTVETEDIILQYPKIAHIMTNLFGSAIKWKRASFDIISDSLLKVNYKIISRKNDSSEDTILLETLNPNINLDEIDAEKFPFLKFDIDVFNPNETNLFEFRRLFVEYSPPPEIAIEVDKPNDTAFINRGDELATLTKIYNLSSRTTAKNLKLKLNSVSQNGIKIIDSTVLNQIKPNSAISIQQKLYTDYFDNQIDLLFQVQTSHPELFNFNNTATFPLKIFEDTIPPQIKLYADSYPLKQGDYVSFTPKILLEIYDNSSLPYDSNSTFLLINGKWVDLTQRAQFTSYGRNYPLKCSYLLESDSLEFGSNYFTIYTTDPSGNRDTLDINVIVSKLAQINDYIAYPNPTTTNLKFQFNYFSPKPIAYARIDIYDQMGNLIRTLQENIKLNQNEIFWDGFDRNGNSIPQGIFFYRINIISEIYCEPVFGKIIKIQ